VQVPWASTGLVSKVYETPGDHCPGALAGGGKCMIGHYTQVVWAKTTKVGCAALYVFLNCVSRLIVHGSTRASFAAPLNCMRMHVFK
jgi:hypothetical protein